MFKILHVIMQIFINLFFIYSAFKPLWCINSNGLYLIIINIIYAQIILENTYLRHLQLHELNCM